MDYRIHTSYSLDEPPEHPGKSWTRFVCLSDTHSRIGFAVPPGDVLIHAGDLSSWGILSHLRPTLDWLRTLPHELKIVIAGNHDLCLDPRWKDGSSGYGFKPKEVDAALKLVRSPAMREAGVIYLDRESVEISTSSGIKWRLYGSPAAPFYAQGAFQYHSTEGAIDEWSRIPTDVDVLITHSPVYGILDKTRRGKHAGCHILASRINALPSCRLHVFGHIHEAHGAKVTKRIVACPNNEIHQIDFISVNGAAYHGAQPIIVDLKKDT